MVLRQFAEQRSEIVDKRFRTRRRSEYKVGAFRLH